MRRWAGLVASAVVVAVGQARAADPTAKELLAKAKAVADTLTRPEEKDEKDDMMKLIVRCQARSGDIAGAKANAALIQRPLVRASALSDVARAMVRAGDVDGAENLMAPQWDAESIDLVLGGIAMGLAEKPDMEGALKTYRRMTTPTGKEALLSVIAAMQAKAGDLKGAEESVKSVARPDYQVIAMSMLAVALTLQKQPVDAKRWMEMARDAQSRNQKPEHGLNYLAEAEACMGNADAVDALITKYAGTPSEGLVFGGVTNGYLEADRVKEAKALGEKLTDAESQFFFVTMMGVYMADSGDKKGAAEALKKAKDLYAKNGSKRTAIWGGSLAGFMCMVEGPGVAVKWLDSMAPATLVQIRGYVRVATILTEPKGTATEPFGN